jgi:hypothetical protein
MSGFVVSPARIVENSAILGKYLLKMPNRFFSLCTCSCSSKKMLDLSCNLTQRVRLFTSYFWAVRDELFSNCFIGNFCAANMHYDGYWHIRGNFVASPIHSVYHTVRNVACLIIEQWNFVSETVDDEVAAFWHTAPVSHSHLNDKRMTRICRWFTLMNYKVLGVEFLDYTCF